MCQMRFKYSKEKVKSKYENVRNCFYNFRGVFRALSIIFDVALSKNSSPPLVVTVLSHIEAAFK